MKRQVNAQVLFRQDQLQADLERVRLLGFEHLAERGGDAVGVGAAGLESGGIPGVQQQVIVRCPAQPGVPGNLVVLEGLIHARARRKHRLQVKTPARIHQRRQQ